MINSKLEKALLIIAVSVALLYFSTRHGNTPADTYLSESQVQLLSGAIRKEEKRQISPILQAEYDVENLIQWLRPVEFLEKTISYGYDIEVIGPTSHRCKLYLLESGNRVKEYALNFETDLSEPFAIRQSPYASTLLEVSLPHIGTSIYIDPSDAQNAERINEKFEAISKMLAERKHGTDH